MRVFVGVVMAVAILALPGIAKAADPPPEAATLTVTPNVDLVDLQAVTVSGTGFPPHREVDLFQCTSEHGGDPCEFTDDAVWPDDDGNFTVVIGLTAFLTGVTGAPVDCRAAPGTCEIRTGGYGSGAPRTAVPLNYDPTAPLADPPTLTATPTTGLVDGQVIDVSGTRLRPGGYLFIFVCKGTTPSDSQCPGSYSAGDDDRVAADGTLDTRFRVRAAFLVGAGSAKRASAEQQHLVDCRVSHCFLSAFEDPYRYDIPLIPLEFDPNAPLAPLPQITVSPSTDLSDRQEVTVTGTDWFPGEDVLVDQCTVSANGHSDTCKRFPWFPVADAGGNFTLQVEVRSVFNDWNLSTTECPAAGCAFFAQRLGAVDREWDRADFAFRDDASQPDSSPAATPTAVQPTFTG